MNKSILLSVAFIVFFCSHVHAQFQQSEAKNWDRIPTGIQKAGFGLNKSQILQMDSTPEEEEVFLFTADNGHYPYFDLFRCYYVVVGNYSKEVKFVSDIILSNSRDLILEDRNKDGVFELYRKYIKEGKFKVDEDGNNLRAEWLYDRIEWKSNAFKAGKK